ncbi:MAG: hypothetical protein QOK40_2355 [Miltoncostaeaceae bacterium]|nr:hypothetical protein [Miltoncostaeaceae bacterium]
MEIPADEPVGLQPPSRRRKPLTAVLQARVTRSEHEVLEHLARRHGITLSDAVRLGAWSYLLARDSGIARGGAESVSLPRSAGSVRPGGLGPAPDDAVS